MKQNDSTDRLIKVSYNQSPLQDIIKIFNSLELNPAFQRKSVWEISDRDKFIKTILEGMPCPTIFLFNRWVTKKKCYINDVIDGKQRLETIFLFHKKLSPEKIQVSRERRKKIRDWINRNNFYKLSGAEQQNFLAFQIPIGSINLKDESDGSEEGMADLIEAFIRINTQGRPLSRQERTNARFIEKPILITAKQLSRRFNDLFYMSSEQEGRMKDTEITSELLISLRKNEILNKKIAIDRAMGENITKKEIAFAKNKFLKICKIIRRIDLGRNTRFVRKTPDFYSLFIAVAELERSGFVFQKYYAKIRKELATFSAKIAEVADAYQEKDFSNLKKMANTPYFKYWSTTQRSSDSRDFRKIRCEIIKNILLRVLKKQKDRNRFFSLAQKEQLWEKSKNKKCSYPGCERPLRWETATIDHIVPWSLGGATDLSNAQLMCRGHNSMKKDKDFLKYFLSKQ